MRFPGKMSGVRPFLAVCLLLWAVSLCRAGEPPFRLAVIDSQDSPLGALLEAEVSKIEGMAVVERQDIAPLIEEKRLESLMADRKFCALGSMLVADGLLVIEKLKLPGGQETRTARLISVKNGSCLFFTTVPSEPATPEWVKGVVAGVRQKLAIARVSREEALPLCVVGLRAEVFTPEAALREAALARLLEMRLAAAPGVVLLDRRGLGDVVFERSLEASDLPSLWESAMLIDGSIKDAGAGQPLKLDLRILQRDGREVEKLGAQGNVGEIPALAERLAGDILKKIHRPSAPGESSVEPREFLREAGWAWQNHLFSASEDALAAALALGETAADAFALQSWLLAERACPEGVFFLGTYLKSAPPPSAQQAALLYESLEYLQKFREAGGKLEVLSPVSFRDLQLPELTKGIVRRASVFLQKGSASADAASITQLRRKVWEATGLNKGVLLVPPSIAAPYLQEWTSNGVMLVGYYEALFRNRDIGGFLQYFPRSRDEALGRFRDEETVDAWESMTRRLSNDPDTRAIILIALAGEARTPEQVSAYREFLSELAARGPELFQTKRLGDALWGYLTRDHARQICMPEQTEAFIALCKALPGFQQGVCYFTGTLKIPEGREGEVWAAFQSYRSRCIRSPDGRFSVARMEKEFGEASGKLLANNSRIQVASSSRALAVSRFWHPYAMDDYRIKEFSVTSLRADGHSVWLFGNQDELLQVSPADGTATRRQFDGAKGSGALSVTPKAVWMLNGSYPGRDQPRRLVLSRLDRETGEVRRFDLPQGDYVEAVGERVFIHYGHPHGGFGQEAGLLEIDPASGAVDVVISSRRRPPGSPLDLAESLGVTGVASGAGNRLNVVISGKSEGIYDTGDDWRRAPSIMLPDVMHYEDLTLLAGARGEAILLDPGADGPRVWLASPDSSPDLLHAARWIAPRVNMDLRFEKASFRRDELFMIDRNGDGEHVLRWWFGGGPREGLEIPLAFAMPEKVADVLKPIPLNHLPPEDIDTVRNPNRSSFTLDILAMADGVILSRGYHGFWFIPNADLDARRLLQMEAAQTNRTAGRER